jgi:undecaprenyl-diphosphatase
VVLGEEPRDPGDERIIRRHPGDVIRVVLGALGVAVTAALAATGHAGLLERDAFHLVNDLPVWCFPVLYAVMQLGTLAAVGVLAGGAALLGRRRVARDALCAGGGAWLLAKVVKHVVGRPRPSLVLGRVILRSVSTAGLGFPSGHAAVAGALAGAIAPYVRRPWRRLAWGAAVLVAAARVYTGAHLPLDAVGGLALGWGVAAGVHLVWGAPARLPSPATICAALRVAGLDVCRLRRLRVDARGSTPFVASTAGGDELFVKVVDREQRDADVLFKAWRFLAFRDVEDEAPFATPKQLVEHEAYVALLGARGGARIPAVRLTSTAPDRSAALVLDCIAGAGLDRLPPARLDDHLLLEIWHQVGLLHGARIAHRDLRRSNVVVDEDGRPWLIDFGFAEAGASDRAMILDVAELLVSLAAVVGPERSVAAAVAGRGREAVIRSLPLLQPLALTRATRSDLRARRELLEDVRRAVSTATGERAPPVEPVVRVRPRTVVALLLAGVCVHFLLPQASELRHTVHALRGTRLGWLAVAAALSALSYVGSAVSVMAAARRPLPLLRTVAMELAASFANRLMPGGLGRAGIIERYLERSGVDRPAAVGTLGLTLAAGLVVHGAGLVIAAVLVGRQGLGHARLAAHWPVLVAVAVVLALVGALMPTAFGRRRLYEPLRRIAGEVRPVLRDPRRAALLLAAASAVTLAYVLALAASLQAVGGHVSMAKVALVYLGGSALASAAPTPGGLGALEAALVAGLGRVGVDAGPAIAGVLAFRLLTYWAPILPGFLCFRWLLRRGYL